MLNHTEARVDRSTEGKHILLVEDDDLVRRFLGQVLRMHGHTVFEAATSHGAASICKQEQGRIHLMVSDLRMPGTNGRQLAKELAHLQPEMKVLFVSGSADDTIVQRGVLDPETAFIQKPFTPDAFMQRVHEVLSA
jgi:two-component system cell cycle sensor histidine kinase/response regulator CckA